jgi:hypothetical protein
MWKACVASANLESNLAKDLNKIGKNAKVCEPQSLKEFLVKWQIKKMCRYVFILNVLRVMCLVHGAVIVASN